VVTFSFLSVLAPSALAVLWKFLPDRQQLPLVARCPSSQAKVRPAQAESFTLQPAPDLQQADVWTFFLAKAQRHRLAL
jgi:hypothetical protein